MHLIQQGKIILPMQKIFKPMLVLFSSSGFLFSEAPFGWELFNYWFGTNDQTKAECPSEEAQLTDAIFPRTNPRIIGQIYQMFKILDLIFTSYNIPYWIDGGALLGAVRHGGLIPWNDKGNIEIYAHDWPRVYALESEFKRFGFEFRETTRLLVKDQDFPFIDIVLTIQEGDKVVPMCKSVWPNNWFYESELFPGQRTQCGPVTLQAPSNPERYLKTHYGDDCMEYAFCEQQGSDLSCLKKVKIEDFNPAAFLIEDPRIPLP